MASGLRVLAIIFEELTKYNCCICGKKIVSIDDAVRVTLDRGEIEEQYFAAHLQCLRNVFSNRFWTGLVEDWMRVLLGSH
jgi:hypothetical protein